MGEVAAGRDAPRASQIVTVRHAKVSRFPAFASTALRVGSAPSAALHRFKEYALGKIVLRRRSFLLAGTIAAPMIASGVARAADAWPNKPVRYINLFPAGGPTDVLSRI